MAAQPPAGPRDGNGAGAGAGAGAGMGTARTSGGSRRVRVRMAQVRTGVSSFAALCGLACYALLAQIHMNLLLAGVLGLAFALLVRVAAGSLVRDWLASQTRAAAPEDAGAQGRRRPGGTPRR